MKVLYHHRIGSKDGQSVHIDEIVSALRNLGHTVIVVGPKVMQRAQFGADAGMVRYLKKMVPAFIYELLELAYSFRAFWCLWWTYWRERPDVLYERYNLYMLAGLWLKRLTGIPMLLEVNAPLVFERSRFSGLANRRLARWIEGVIWRGADVALPVTNVLAGFLREVGVAPERIVIVQNGIASEFLTTAEDGAMIRRRFNLEGKVVLGFTGFVREWHGLDRVITFIAESDPKLNLALMIVGDGPAIPDLRRQAAASNLENRVIFAGLVPRHNVISYIAAFDVALQPQVVPYASPLKLFEYMALARAIVAPSSANIREVLSEEAAVLFDPDDPAAFPAAVKKLSQDRELRATLGAAARAALERQGLTWHNNARRIESLFVELTSGTRKASTSKVQPIERRIATDQTSER